MHMNPCGIIFRTAAPKIFRFLSPSYINPFFFQQVIAFAQTALLPGMTQSGVSDGTYNGCFNTQLVQANGQNLLDLKR